MIQFHSVFSRLVNRPLFADAATAMTIYNVVAGRAGLMQAEVPNIAHREQLAARVDARRVQSSQFAGDRVRSDDQSKFPAVEPFRRTPEGVGIVTVDGELVNRGAWIGSDSGLVSYEGTKFQLDRAARDPKTKAIILDINSPGGEAIGSGEMAGFVRKVRDHKPVFAIANGMAASAGYAMASGATRVFNTQGGLLGSIGCILLHMDMTKAAEQQGVKPTLITAGANKATGHPFKELTDDDAAELQKTVNLFYDEFAQTVGAGRKSKLSAKAAKATEAQSYIGKDAVTAGLADDVGSFEDILAELSAKLKRR